MNIWDLIKLKIFLHNEENYKQCEKARFEKAPFKMEKITANKATDKELFPRL